MPTVSDKQRRYMGLCSSRIGRSKARKKCPPMKVAKEFLHADKGKKFS